MRPVQVEDVLGREPVDVDLRADRLLPRRTQTVLVTGAGGSIGSELCRQIARIGCKRLDPRRPVARRALFEIERELVSERGFAAERAGARRRRQPRRRCAQVFERYRPAVVFHAAAYKHVPLMEANPVESVRNNVARHEDRSPTSRSSSASTRFVLVSTDKARQPDDGDGPVEGAVRVDRRGATAHRADVHDPLRRGALRQRARLVGQRDPDLPPADRARRPGHGHAPGDDALLHDDPGGGAADRPGRRDRRPRRDLRARHGRAGEDPRPRAAT